MRSKNKLILLTLPILVFSCQFVKQWFNGVEDLGSSYYYIWESKFILKTEAEEYSGIGTCVIPPTVLKVNHNDKAIVVYTENGVGQHKYWLIDKTIDGVELQETVGDSLYWGYSKYSNVFGPMDSVDFFEMKKQKKVRLEW